MSGTIRALVAAGVITAAALVLTISATASGATTCNGVLAPGSYQTVVVPAGGVCFSDGPVKINGGLWISQGGTFVLGNEETPGDNGSINGGVHATNAMNVQIHFATINGGVEEHGGSGPFGGPFDVAFNTIEDSRINGGVTIDGYDGFWMGFFRNTVNGDVNYNNNTLVDPDGNEIQTNVIHGGLSCAGNDPAPQSGDSGGNPNQVTGPETGQCVGL